MKQTHSFRTRRQRAAMVLVLLIAAVTLGSCTTNETRRDEPSPFAPQWRALRQHR